MTPERYARIKALFTKATELTEPERDAFLTRECNNDIDLKVEVESLLRHDHSQTIISAKDKTVKNIRREVADIPSKRSLGKRLRGFGNLTAHLGPRGQFAIGALVSFIALTLLGYFGNRSIGGFQKELRREALNEIVEGKVLALEMWLEHETSKIESWTTSNQLRRQVSELVKLADESEDFPKKLRKSPIQAEIRQVLHSFAGRDVHYSIWDRRHLLIADTFMEVDRFGDLATPWGSSILAYVFEGNSRMFAFDRQNTITRFGSSIQIEPHIGVVTPIRGESGQIIAALLVHDDKSRENASRILSMIRLGESGESYVFNRDGLMLSQSRFSDQLRELGLISDAPNSTMIREIYLRDPGGDLTAGFIPDEPLSTKPLTKMARLCTAGQDGDDLDGYRDYRGVKVVGAWRWVEELDVGVATELDLNEAEPGLQTLIWESWIVLGLFATCLSIALFSFYSVHRMRQQVGENHKLGQYKLERQIGEGGMGKVFKARHELLKRPTAVKLLKPEFLDRESTARFEREARLASQLEHANTIRVYDYGVTPQGLFYYVMEYIDGINLTQLIELETAIPPARTIFLLRQICFSLREAHDAGMVHRDLKPSNIMVCRRGGEFDVVKVLDFGLVKNIENSKSQQITSTNLVAGTPQYIAPERLSDSQTNDPRSDIYSLGAVAYFLLTGKDFVEGESLAEILLQVINTSPKRPSMSTETHVPPELDELIYDCLAKDPNDRPCSVTEVISALDGIPSASLWTLSEAESWWKMNHNRVRNST